MTRIWEMVALEQLGKITSSKRIFKSEYVDIGIPFYRTKEIKELANGRTISTELYISNDRFEEIKRQFGTPKRGDLLITAIGTIGEIYVVNNTTNFYFKDGNVLWLKDFKDIEPYFLKYSLMAFIDQLNNISHGSAYQALPIEKLKKHKIPKPPLPEQKRIVAILDEAFEGIDRAIANTEKNLANARELFEGYLNAIFIQKNKDWERKKLQDICLRVNVGYVGLMKSQYQNTGIPFLRSQNILPFKITLKNVAYIDDDFHNSLKKSKLKPGDVAIVRTGYPGTAAVIPESLSDCNCSDLVIITPGSNINPHYLCLFFNSNFGKNLVSGNLVGAAQKHFNVTAAKKVAIPYPPISEQNKLVVACEKIAAETQRLEAIYKRKLEALKELKQSILHKAFTGELTADTAKEATKKSEEVAA